MCEIIDCSVGAGKKTIKIRGRPRNIQKEPPREIISTTGESFYVSRIQSGNTGHATGKVKYDVNGTFSLAIE